MRKKVLELCKDMLICFSQFRSKFNISNGRQLITLIWKMISLKKIRSTWKGGVDKCLFTWEVLISHPSTLSTRPLTISFSCCKTECWLNIRLVNTTGISFLRHLAGSYLLPLWENAILIWGSVIFLHVHWHHVNVTASIVPNHPSVDRHSAYTWLLQSYKR